MSEQGNPGDTTRSIPPVAKEGSSSPTDPTLDLGRGERRAVAGVPERLERIGRYRLDGILGRGGMGLVYQAYDLELRRPVALKVIKSELAQDVDLYRRFHAEAQVTAQLFHPAVIPVHEVGARTNGDLYYTMQLIKGRTLTRIVEDEQHYLQHPEEDERPLADRWTRFRLLQAFGMVCRTIAYAHSRGVVHRDLKPDNLMVGKFGQVYVLDWGVAKVLGQTPERPDAVPRLAAELEEAVETTSEALTQVGAVLGTPAYMAPEQATASEGASDPLIDVYALGAILYYVLTGRPPHTGSVTEILKAIASGIPPARPSEQATDLPADLDQICMWALQYDRTRRLGSADELGDAVQAYLEGRPLKPQGRASGSDSGYLRSYSTRLFRKPSVTVDVVLLDASGPRPAVLLTLREKPPFAGTWALPGGFISLDETLLETAQRLLSEKCGVSEVLPLEQLGAYGAPGRDPRTRVITVAFVARLPAGRPRPEVPGESRWFELTPEGQLVATEEELELAFDHADILVQALGLEP